MSLIIVQRLELTDGKLQIPIEELTTRYPKFCVKGVNLDVYINRIFNEERRVIDQPQISAVLPITGEIYHYVDLSSISMKLGIPYGYFIEILVSNFVGKTHRIPIFPNEIKLDVDISLRKIIEDEIKTLEKVGKTYETIGLLSDHGFSKLATLLRDGIIRFEKSDYEGSIMSLRKVVEGFKELMKDKIVDGSENRSKEIRGFLNKAYGLLSNFGQHVSTHGLIDEAMFAKELTVLISSYLIKKI